MKKINTLKAKDEKTSPNPIPDAPVAKLRRLGFLKGKIAMPDDFDSMGEEESIRLFGLSK